MKQHHCCSETCKYVLCCDFDGNYFNWSKQTKLLAILCVKYKFHNINFLLVDLFYKSNIALSMQYHTLNVV